VDFRLAAVAVIEAVVVIEVVVVIEAAEVVEAVAATARSLSALSHQIEKIQEDKDPVVVAILMAVRNSFPISAHRLTIS